MINYLQAAIDQLEKHPSVPEVDRTDLEELVAEAENIKAEDYTKASYEKLVEALEKAKAILEDEEATQAEVDAAYASLQAAIDQLEKNPSVPKADKTDLEELVAEAEKLKADDYTKASYEKLIEALEKAKAVLEDEEVTQAEIDDAIADLKLAIADLKVVQSEEPTDPAPDGDRLPGTATSIYNWLTIGFVLLIVGGFAVFVINRKRKSTE
ncbi:hypothetical protein ACS127_15475 [Amphibacillus sp. Q70]|uniref:hypothetical protein n=1 Tax=Amphibacillus sp. Q70 TaxID=3453416 RepID=UPI003F85A0A9